jgi:aryl-alcohol dehydrogenase-like predicted oxidoreductase
VARAIELGITYFDTAPLYGDGESERHLGQALRALGRAATSEVRVGTKVRVGATPLEALPAFIARSLDQSLSRLGRDSVDLLQLHDPIGPDGAPLSAPIVLEAIVPALRKAVGQGKTRFFGITALGDTAALHALLAAGALDSAQICINLLNPSAAHPLPAQFPGQDFGGLLARAREHGVGGIAIRVLAAGALSASEARHPLAAPRVGPIASGADYASDVRRAAALSVLVDEGHVSSPVEAAIRFALAADGVSTALVGYSSLEQLELAAAAAEKGPLAREALARLPELWRGFAAI